MVGVEQNLARRGLSNGCFERDAQVELSEGRPPGFPAPPRLKQLVLKSQQAAKRGAGLNGARFFPAGTELEGTEANAHLSRSGLQVSFFSPDHAGYSALRYTPRLGTRMGSRAPSQPTQTRFSNWLGRPSLLNTPGPACNW